MQYKQKKYYLKTRHNKLANKRIKPFPIILVHKNFWSPPLMNWFKTKLLPRKLIKEQDFELFTVEDDPDEVVGSVKMLVIA